MSSTAKQKFLTILISFRPVLHTEKSDIFILQLMSGCGPDVTSPRLLYGGEKHFVKQSHTSVEPIDIYLICSYRVSNGCSPCCVNLNLPAMGHRTGAGFLAVY